MLLLLQFSILKKCHLLILISRNDDNIQCISSTLHSAANQPENLFLKSSLVLYHHQLMFFPSQKSTLYFRNICTCFQSNNHTIFFNFHFNWKTKKKTGELFSALQPHYQLPIPKSSSLVSILFSNISKLYITLFLIFHHHHRRRHRHNLHTQKHSSSSSYQVIMGFVSVKYKV